MRQVALLVCAVACHRSDAAPQPTATSTAEPVATSAVSSVAPVASDVPSASGSSTSDLDPNLARREALLAAQQFGRSGDQPQDLASIFGRDEGHLKTNFVNVDAGAGGSDVRLIGNGHGTIVGRRGVGRLGRDH